MFMTRCVGLPPPAPLLSGPVTGQGLPLYYLRIHPGRGGKLPPYFRGFFRGLLEPQSCSGVNRTAPVTHRPRVSPHWGQGAAGPAGAFRILRAATLPIASP